MSFDDPNREAVGLEPIWGDETRDNDPATPVGDDEPEGDEELPGGVAAFTIAQVQEWVDAHPHAAADVLVHEQARGAAKRSTLIDWLEGFVESHDG